MAENTVVYYGTGRRKNAVARVRIVPVRLPSTSVTPLSISAVSSFLRAPLLPSR